GSGSSLPTYIVALNSTTLLFSANDGSHGCELWKSDGTTSGTVMVRDLNTGSPSSSPTALTVLNGRAYFAATTPAYGNEFWSSDGTPSGTSLVSDIYAGALSSNPTGFVVVGTNLFFTATDATHPSRLWILNPSSRSETAPGTSLVSNISVGALSSNPTGFVVVGANPFFTATDATHPSRLGILNPSS